MLSAKLRVPVDFGVIKFENTASLADFDEHIVRSSQDLVAKGSELALCADVVHFVDDGTDCGILIHDNLSNDVLVGEVLPPNVEVSFL